MALGTQTEVEHWPDTLASPVPVAVPATVGGTESVVRRHPAAAAAAEGSPAEDTVVDHRTVVVGLEEDIQDKEAAGYAGIVGHLVAHYIQAEGLEDAADNLAVGHKAVAVGTGRAGVAAHKGVAVHREAAAHRKAVVRKVVAGEPGHTVAAGSDILRHRSTDQAVAVG